MNQKSNMAPTRKYEELRKQAAEKRRKLISENKENIMGLASVVPVKTITDQLTQQQNREKHLSIIKWVIEVNAARSNVSNNWNKPTDWRIVTEKTVHKYIPFENTTLSQAFEQVIQNLARFEKPKTRIDVIDDNTPLWYLSRNNIRRALRRASRRHHSQLVN